MKMTVNLGVAKEMADIEQSELTNAAKLNEQRFIRKCTRLQLATQVLPPAL